jgi:hypothetical protein
MHKKYMDKYLELSKEFKETNESQKTIEKIYEFIDELEREENIDNEIILINIYVLLKYHQKAYDLYKKQYAESEAKAKDILLKLKQKAETSGDKFAIKIKENH